MAYFPYISEYTLFFKMGAEVEGNVECSVASFMEELQRYESLNNKFSKGYKNKHVRDNCWLAMGKKFNTTAEEAEKKHKSIRSSYGRCMAAKGREDPIGFWKGCRAFCRRLCKSRVARTAHKP